MPEMTFAEYTMMQAHVKEINRLRAENERLRAEQKTSLSASILKDAERWRKVRPQLYVYYNSGTEHWQLCMVDGGISGHADYFPTVEQAIDEALKDGS